MFRIKCYVHFLCIHACYMPAYVILLDYITVIIFGEGCKL
jgi:hypothetical protein